MLSLFPTKALKKQFPKYALDAFSYGGRLYGAPYALENVGLVVNTRLVKVPKTFAQFEKEALAFKRKSPDNIALAVPQGSGGDAYHMYPFFSGLGGFVFGHAKNGALQIFGGPAGALGAGAGREFGSSRPHGRFGGGCVDNNADRVHSLAHVVELAVAGRDSDPFGHGLVEWFAIFPGGATARRAPPGVRLLLVAANGG